MTSLSRIHAKFRPLTVVLPAERIIKESIKIVLEAIYDREYPETAEFRASPGGRHAVLNRIKKKWEPCRWYLQINIRKLYQNIDRHRLMPVLKEEIDDPQFFFFIQKVLYPGRPLQKLPSTVPESVILSVVLGNIYLHKLDQEIARLLKQCQIPMAEKVRSVLRTGPPVDDEENSGEEDSSNALQDSRASLLRRIKSNQRKAVFTSLVSSHHNPTSTPYGRVWDQKKPPSSF